MEPTRKHEKIKLVEINPHLTCHLCKGYLIDATTISECLHSFCRSCIIKFLQENCYCPICEVIINKAKPCLKQDKILQDVVYKLVPELFIKEMYRRRLFYLDKPELAGRVSPEERGEDTERTIFNPRDDISLSIEYISDDSTPGAIPMFRRNEGVQTDGIQDNPMKRYLQCPAMCRIDVLKKFVQNKYNVDTNLFHIDILYKRVPLPDHYTLVDIGYIYSYKRNEPMKFFFRITDKNKLAERFDYFDGSAVPEVVQIPTRTRLSTERKSRKSEASHRKEEKVDVKKEAEVKKELEVESDVIENEVTDKTEVQASVNDVNPDVNEVISVKNEVQPSVEEQEHGKNELKATQLEALPIKTEVKPSRDEVKSPEVQPSRDEPVSIKTEVKPNRAEQKSTKTEVKPRQKPIKAEVKPPSPKRKPISHDVKVSEIAETIKNKIQNGKTNLKNSVYTNITLNRDDNVEIITKIQKVSNKEGQPIGLNIINHTVKKTNKVQNNNKSPTKTKPPTPPPPAPPKVPTLTEDEDLVEKSKFLRSIQLTARSSLVPKPTPPPVVKPTTSGVSSSASPKPQIQNKRKSSSPMKNDKKPKVEKKPMKIIIQPKTIANPAVRQIVTNVNQNVNTMSKIVEQSSTKSSDLQSLIDSCKIPSSLSITVNEGSEGSTRTPPSIPPVKNYIEILKIPDNKSTEIKLRNQTFQKIFEESIKNNNNGEKRTPLDLSNHSDSTPKRKSADVIPQLAKKIKTESNEPKIAIPRLAMQRTLKPSTLPSRTQSANMHSASLGLNYMVSVGPKQGASSSTSKVKSKSPSPSGGGIVKNNGNLNPNHLLEEYNIKNLAQMAAANFNFNPSAFTGSQIQAIQQAILMKHIQHQSWLKSQQQGHQLMQYEKYVQSLNATQNKIMGNIKEN